MQLLFFRHGIAQDLAPNAPASADAARALTDQGIRKTRAAVAGLAQLLKGQAPQIMTSPKVRAAQTADILADALDAKPQTMTELASASTDRLLRRLAKLNDECVILVGHEPALSQMVAHLCAGSAPHSFIQLKKAGCACIDIEGKPRPGAGTLLWLATPKMLAATGD
ncbi:MAG: phosphohistidine phosphatase SixA [Phycisphaeraceae bacterium]